MFRKAIFALTALTALGAASLAPTAASAGWKHHHGWNSSFYIGAPAYIYGGPTYVVSPGYRSCWVRRWVETPFGPRLQRFYVCG